MTIACQFPMTKNPTGVKRDECETDDDESGINLHP